MNGIFDGKSLAQVGFVVRDIEAAKKRFAEILGVPVPPTCDGGDYAVTHTVVEGKPAPEANAKLAFFDTLPGFQIELIEPNGVKSCWQDFLDEHGEGIHHIAFKVKDTEETLKACAEQGYPCAQRGVYGDGGGEYAYIDARADLKCIIETLQNY